FGHEKGAFKKATSKNKGKFELAAGGTLFLDEIGDMNIKTQAKILRALESKTFQRIGGGRTLVMDVRLMASTNKDLEKEIKAGNFREDLFFRLNVIPIHVPPLRKRIEDLPLLADTFLGKLSEHSSVEKKKLSKDALALLMEYDWPGNVRELKNVIQFSVVRSRGNVILPTDLPFASNRQPLRPVLSNEPAEPNMTSTRGKLNKENVQAALVKTGGNKSKAARVLGVGRATLYRFLSDHPEVKAFSDTF
ncbi:MAG: sigma 54-interacting transcriptional regulator, partial [Desulfobacterales bacterium]|nr:sigma 54-interacting transcriptional regulator [Desulfobacterales bacterium]